MSEKKDSEVGPLPEALARAAKELRSWSPPEALEDRLSRALARADVEAARAERETRARPNRLLTAALTFVPTAAAALVAMHLAFGEPTEEVEQSYIERFEEVHVDLGDDVPHWLDLELLTHHHEGGDALLHIDAPRDVEVMATEHAEPHVDGVSCVEERCVHRFHQPHAHPERTPVQIGIKSPGRYRIRVEHASGDARVREEFVVHAH